MVEGFENPGRFSCLNGVARMYISALPLYICFLCFDFFFSFLFFSSLHFSVPVRVLFLIGVCWLPTPERVYQQGWSPSGTNRRSPHGWTVTGTRSAIHNLSWRALAFALTWLQSWGMRRLSIGWTMIYCTVFVQFVTHVALDFGDRHDQGRVMDMLFQSVILGPCEWAVTPITILTRFGVKGFYVSCRTGWSRCFCFLFFSACRLPAQERSFSFVRMILARSLISWLELVSTRIWRWQEVYHGYRCTWSQRWWLGSKWKWEMSGSIGDWWRWRLLTVVMGYARCGMMHVDT